MSNKKIGNSVEQQALEYLQSLGFWTHLLVGNANGQPFDIIALKGDKAFCLDVKNVDYKSNIFPYSRIEENQKYSMEEVSKVSSAISGFIIYHNEKFYMLYYTSIKTSKLFGAKSTNVNVLPLLKDALISCLQE